jgi:hypothetical protein
MSFDEQGSINALQNELDVIRGDARRIFIASVDAESRARGLI